MKKKKLEQLAHIRKNFWDNYFERNKSIFKDYKKEDVDEYKARKTTKIY